MSIQLPPIETINDAMIEGFIAAGMKEFALQLTEAKENYINPKNKYLDSLITQDAEMLKLKDNVKKLIEVDDPVLIIGETGTGKELISNALHGKRRGPFVSINCAGMPTELIESELFGHIKGAFTGAVNNKIGLLEIASNGTMFLDEIGELEVKSQAKLLRAVQEKKIRKVGSTDDIAINCRIVSATHKDIDREHFRQDLFWRLSTFILRPTPLRNRLDDIPLIIKSLDKDNKFNIESFMQEIKEQKNAQIKLIDTAPILAMTTYPLPGNVRELQQIIRKFYVLGE